MVTFPTTGRMSCKAPFRKVVLPEPTTPHRATIRPGFASKYTHFKVGKGTPGNWRLTLVICKSVVMAGFDGKVGVSRGFKRDVFALSWQFTKLKKESVLNMSLFD